MSPSSMGGFATLDQLLGISHSVLKRTVKEDSKGEVVE